MYKIIDFNSVWEIGFAINVVFVFFQPEPFLEKRFRIIQMLGENLIKIVIVKQHDQDYVQRCGWRGLIFTM